MAYTLLWTAIERYAGLRYHLGKDVQKKVYQIASEDIFARSLKRHVKHPRYVFRTNDLSKYTLDPNSPEKSIKYYFQVRSNSVHRGKVAGNDFDIIKNSLQELLYIFKEMLNAVWADEYPSEFHVTTNGRIDGKEKRVR